MLTIIYVVIIINNYNEKLKFVFDNVNEKVRFFNQIEFH